MPEVSPGDEYYFTLQKKQGDEEDEAVDTQHDLPIHEEVEQKSATSRYTVPPEGRSVFERSGRRTLLKEVGTFDQWMYAMFKLHRAKKREKGLLQLFLFAINSVVNAEPDSEVKQLSDGFVLAELFELVFGRQLRLGS